MVNIKQLPLTDTVESEFPAAQWNELLDRMTTLFHLTPERKERIRTHKIMKLTAALPYIAGCRNPMRTALSHLSVYLIAASEGGKDVFMHNFSDNSDLFSRLERISHFDGGNEILIKRGMNMLALAMLGDHHFDAEQDRQNRKYNPLNTGAWKYDELSRQLKEEIRSVPCRNMDNIMNIEDEAPSYWDA